jgi:hypothetical protein
MFKEQKGMKSYVKILIPMLWFIISSGSVFSQEETRINLSLYTSTVGEVQFNFRPQWKFPFLRGESPLTNDNNLTLKLNVGLSPISTDITGDAVFTLFPFFSATFGAMVGTGWNYDLFGKYPLAGLGLNRKTNADDPNDGVIGNGLDGVVWNIHAGTTVQFDFAAIFPGDWNHIVIQLYNEIQYFSYTKAKDDELWYYLIDEGMNQNSFRYKFDWFVGYAMPVFVDLVGVQFSGTLPIYNFETGVNVRDIGFSLDTAFLTNFRINKYFSLMTLVRFTNGLKVPITSNYEREWGFDRIRFLATWRIK